MSFTVVNFPDVFCRHIEESITPIAAANGLATAHVKCDLGDITEEDIWHREGNEIIKPFVAIFRAQGAQLTAVARPFMATITATLEAMADPSQVGAVKSIVDTWSAINNGAVLRIVDGETSYTVNISTSTCSVNQQARDVGFWEGTVVPVQTVITYTVVEGGVASAECVLAIDGHVMPFFTVKETHTVATENTTTDPDTAVGRVSASMEMFGITAAVALTDTDGGDYLQHLIEHPTANRPHAVEYTKNGRTHLRLMTLGTIESDAPPPQMVGVTLSFADISPEAADFAATGSLWRKINVDGQVVALAVPRVCAVFWGDNASSKITDGWAYHRYTDGETTHTVRIMDYSANARWAKVETGDTLGIAQMRLNTVGKKYTANMPTYVLPLAAGDGLYVRDGRLCMVADGVLIPIDKPETDSNGLTVYYMDSEPFEWIGKGEVVKLPRGYAWEIARY